jgi:hypothetical protein
MIRDPELVLNGYQPHLTHKRPGCNTTISVRVISFRSYYEGPFFSVRNMGSPTCPGYCTDPNNFESCSNDCDLRWIRDIMQMFKQHTVFPAYLKKQSG